MVIFRPLLLAVLLLPYCSFAAVSSYQPNRNIKNKTWEQVAPYLLPPDHPLKYRMDRLFSRKRVTLNLKSMKKAGFKVTKPRQWTHLVIATHPKLPGHLIKLYLDAQKCHKNQPDVHFWTLRAEGVKKIKEMIHTYGWEEDFKVPKKWIYPLPEGPHVPKGYHRKQFILLEEDMDILDQTRNSRKWRSSVVDRDLLDKLFCILDQLGLKDCAKPDNIPFAKDGKIAFIDTQTHNSPPVNYSKLTPFLSPSMQSHWKALIK